MKVRVNADEIPAGLPAKPELAVAKCTYKATQSCIAIPEKDGWVVIEILGGEPGDLEKLKAAGFTCEELPD